jgi:putative hydrolases of HD superfamily
MKNIIDLIRDIGKVKKVKRSGWIRVGIKDPESVADHSYRVAVMAMMFGKTLNVDVDKLIKMVLVHDLGEGSIGDVVVERGAKVDAKSREEKDKKEIEMVKQIFASMGDGDVFANLQEESLRMESREARILKQLERLEMAIQALEYEKESGKDLTEFFDNATMHIEDGYLKKLLETVKSSRPKRS